MKTDKSKTTLKTNSSKMSLSDKIVDALTLKPRPDIEDDQVFGTKPQTVSRADLSSTDSEDDTLISDFMKRNVSLLSEIDKKYSGEVVPRKEIIKDNVSTFSQEDQLDTQTDPVQDGYILSDEDQSSSESHDKIDQNISKTTFNESSEAETDDESLEEKSDKGSDLSDEDNEGYDISKMAEPPTEAFEHMTKKNISEEAKKGSCVKSQLLLWEGLLEMRIHTQRCVNTANQMPMFEAYKIMKQSPSFFQECNKVKTSVSNLLDRFLTLQNLLLAKYPETKSLSNAQNISTTIQDPSDGKIADEDNEEIPSDTESEDDTKQENEQLKPMLACTKKRKLEDYEKEISQTHKAFKSFRDSTIQKWYEKTRITSANIKNAPVNTIQDQISYILADRDKLLRRTQLKRCDYDIIGYKKSIPFEGQDKAEAKDRRGSDEYIMEIFDDSDFYHQLLRELIECKSADVTDPVQLSRQWIALQQMRSKVKRKVDTKATKGRKIKYVVHNKLVNFMAPEKCNVWTDDSINELHSSLFGKMFEEVDTPNMSNTTDGFKLLNG